MSVSMKPGATALMVSPSAAMRGASSWTHPMTPALDAA